MNKKEIVGKMTNIENILTGDGQEEYLRLLDEFIGLYDKLRGLDNDNTRDISIRCVDKMFEHNLLKSKYYEQNDEFIFQDIIHNEINKALKIKEDDEAINK
tara:strand:+ start:742 stop:1044 length:303 start_codon:yes stop_codon:yes gene_type:complete